MSLAPMYNSDKRFTYLVSALPSLSVENWDASLLDLTFSELPKASWSLPFYFIGLIVKEEISTGQFPISHKTRKMKGNAYSK